VQHQAVENHLRSRGSAGAPRRQATEAGARLQLALVQPSSFVHVNVCEYLCNKLQQVLRRNVVASLRSSVREMLSRGSPARPEVPQRVDLAVTHHKQADWAVVFSAVANYVQHGVARHACASDGG